jgi:hypothetical protein
MPATPPTAALTGGIGTTAICCLGRSNFLRGPPTRERAGSVSGAKHGRNQIWNPRLSSRGFEVRCCASWARICRFLLAPSVGGGGFVGESSSRRSLGRRALALRSGGGPLAMRTVPLSIGGAARRHRNRSSASVPLTSWLAGPRTKLVT